MKRYKVTLLDIIVLTKEIAQERLSHYNDLTNHNEPGTPPPGDLRRHTIYRNLFSLPLLVEKTFKNKISNIFEASGDPVRNIVMSEQTKIMYYALSAPLEYDFLTSLVVGVKIIMPALKFINPINLRSFVIAETFHRVILYKEMFKSLKVSSNSDPKVTFSASASDFDVNNYTIGDIKNRLNTIEKYVLICIVLKNISSNL
ncbi:hypothetical protein J4G08_01495 [Candidatus Poribacteria bacterium]|nr:hypothetical protein [Candidatus Poribacteria bacterium]